MGVRIVGTFSLNGGLDALLEQRGDRARKHAIEKMRDEALEIGVLAQMLAPRDTGALERAIEVEDVGGGRDARGRFLRKAIRVYVNTEAPGSGGADTVGQYADIMHDGFYNLGPNSTAKAVMTGLPVGRRFLERALEYRLEGAQGAIKAALARYF